MLFLNGHCTASTDEYRIDQSSVRLIPSCLPATIKLATLATTPSSRVTMATITPRCSLSLLLLAVTAAHAVTAHAPTQLQLSPQNTEYRSHCEGDTADPKWPCFTFWKGDLRDSWAVLDHSPDSPNDFFLAKDGALTGT